MQIYPNIENQEKLRKSYTYLNSKANQRMNRIIKLAQLKIGLIIILPKLKNDKKKCNDCKKNNNKCCKLNKPATIFQLDTCI